MAKRMIPNVVRGGAAIPLKGKTNYYYMTGRKHENGGIDIGQNPRTGLEVEDGEVMHVGKNEVKVFSSVPFLNGESPAEKVMKGDNPSKVFNAQEKYKDKNNINDDGTKKKQNSGKTTNKNKYITTLNDEEEKEFQNWYSKVAKYKKLNPNPDADGQDYDYRGYWKNEDREGILGSNPNAHFTDKYKQPSHPTFSNESKYSNNETPGGTWVKGKETWLFKHNKFTARQADRTADYLNGTGEGFILGNDTIISNKIKKMGGLSRSKDYGSKSKPYPKVKAGDFAGGNRSYPIPTKADAVDALRLAGLHGRSDVRAKVYNKYPELRKKSKAGGLYSVTVDGKTKLKMFHSTGERTKAAYGTEDSNKDNSNWFNKTTNKIKEYIDDNPDAVSDGIGLTSNILGSIISHKMNKDILNKMQYTPQPISRTATKLKTKININPQLNKMRETLSAYERNIDNNTASSRVALARKQRARLANMLQTNELYGNKENIETELINKDRLNQQAVADSNIKDYNAWRERKAAFDNAILEKKTENDVSLIENINTGVQDIIGKRQKRKSENQTITAMALANPNLPIEVFYEQGLINKKTYNAYKKAYKNNKKDKQD